MANKAEQYLAALRELEEKTGSVVMSALVTLDGLVIASTTSEQVNKEALAAYSAATFKSSMETMHELSGEETESLLFESKGHRVALVRVTEDVLLGALTGKATKTGIVLLEMNKAAEKIKGIISPKVG